MCQYHVYLTFLRDPLQRAISHYYHWKRTPDLNNRVCIKLLEENWSLEKFLFSPFFQNFYSQFFFGFNMNKFDFIGISERFDESIDLLRVEFSDFLELNVSQNFNINTEKVIGVNYVIDSNLALMFKKNNELDYRIYDDAMAILNSKKSNRQL